MIRKENQISSFEGRLHTLILRPELSQITIDHGESICIFDICATPFDTKLIYSFMHSLENIFETTWEEFFLANKVHFKVVYFNKLWRLANYQRIVISSGESNLTLETKLSRNLDGFEYINNRMEIKHKYILSNGSNRDWHNQLKERKKQTLDELTPNSLYP